VKPKNQPPNANQQKPSNFMTMIHHYAKEITED